MADGGVAAHLGRSAGRAVRARASWTRTGSSGRSAGGRRRERDLAAFVARPGARSSTPTRPGVNAWLDRDRGSLGLASSPTRRRRPEPWTDLDTVAWAKVQAWNLGGNLDTEIFRYLADAQLGDPARTDELFPPYRDGAPVITPTGLPGSGGAGAGRPPGATAAAAPTTRRPWPRAPTTDAQAAAWRRVAALGRAVLRGRPASTAATASSVDHGIGSNNWVVGPEHVGDRRRAARQRPAPRHLDAVDLVHERAPLPDVSTRPARTTSPGVCFPGAPGVVLGHNARIAWGATNVDPDVQDLVIETVDPADPGSYLTERRLDAVHDPPRGRSRSSGGDPVDARRPRDGPRPDPQRGRRPPRRRAADGPALDRAPGAGPHARGHPGPRTVGGLRRLPAPPCRCTGRPPRTSCTPTSTATSATSSRATCRSARTRPTAAIRPVDGSDGAARVDRAHPVRRPALAARPGRRAGSSPPTTPRSTRTTRLRSASEWDPGYRAERILDLIGDYGAGRPDGRRDRRDPDRQRPAARPRRRVRAQRHDRPGVGGVAVTTADGAAHPRPHRRVGRRAARSTASAAPRT